MIEDLITAGVIASAIRLATPYLYAALGETFGQRSGVLNLGVEGVMLMGAFMSFWAVYESTPDGATAFNISALMLGLLVAISVGAIMGLATAFINVTLQAEQGISGIGIYLFGLGMSALLYDKNFTGTESVRGFPKIDLPVLSDIPFFGRVVFQQNVLVYAAFAMVPVTWFIINRTTFGLQIRAVGQNPAAADTVGISVTRVRYIALIIGGIMASLAGASLSIAEHNVFFYNMTAGQGFIAVALVYFGAWRARGVLLGALLFSVVTALENKARTVGIGIPDEYLRMAPYVLTIIALVFASQRIDQPAALTKPFERGE
jgi:simple sugar transport system permease protein